MADINRKVIFKIFACLLAVICGLLLFSSCVDNPEQSTETGGNSAPVSVAGSAVSGSSYETEGSGMIEAAASEESGQTASNSFVKPSSAVSVYDEFGQHVFRLCRLR